VTTTTAGTGYTGTISWSGSPSTFAAATVYTATITLTTTSNYTLTGVSANFFTVAGSTSVTHSADSGVITAVFPATAKAIQATLSITSLTTSTKAYPYEQALLISTSGGSGTGATTFTIASGGSASGCALSNSTATASIIATTDGTCRIQATKAADSTYNETTSAAATFIFDKASQSITFTTPSAMTVGGSNQTVSPTASSSLTVTLTSTTTGICTVAGFVITAVSPGTCSITASQAGNANYLRAFDVVRTFGILQASQSITFTTPSAMTVGGSNQTVSPTASSSLTVTLTSTTTGICTVAGFVITAVSPGTCSITASQAGNANYLRAFDVVRTFGILQASQSITFTTPSAMTVGGSNQTVSPTASSSLTVTLTSTTTGICTVAGFVITAVSPGTCSITASQAGNSNYQAAADVVRTFGITAVINMAAIAGVAAPVAGATPVSATTAGTGYTGTVSWSGSPSTFAANMRYTATITLNATSGYTLTGVSANFFTVAGAASVTHSANSGVITAVFYMVGSTGPANGKVFYVASTPFDCGPTINRKKCTYLEAAPGTWQGPEDAYLAWADQTPPHLRTTSVTTGSAIGSGYQNSLNIVDQGNGATTAAGAVRAYTVTEGGVVFNDWFLPSRDELNALYLVKNIFTDLVTNNYYWSSTENISTSSWAQSFFQGSSITINKGTGRYVRPIRSF
jgi:hypothetical protein